jgi:hypothetical protein
MRDMQFPEVQVRSVKAKTDHPEEGEGSVQSVNRNVVENDSKAVARFGNCPEYKER